MIYPPNADINEQVARTMILELYTLPKIESWHAYDFAKKFGVIVTSKMDIRKIAADRNMNIRDILGNYKQRVKQAVVAMCLFLSFNLSAQVQPKADTAKFVQGVGNSFNVLTNDIGANLKVTSWSLNGVKKDTGKAIAILGIGSIKINGKGLLTYVCTNPTFTGNLPDISYVANNTLLRGVSAKVTISVFKRVVVSDTVFIPQFRILKSNGQVLVDYGGIIYVGELQDYFDGCKHLYAVIADNSYYPINKQWYDVLLTK